MHHVCVNFRQACAAGMFIAPFEAVNSGLECPVEGNEMML
jgi:hypothetical protein